MELGGEVLPDQDPIHVAFRRSQRVEVTARDRALQIRDLLLEHRIDALDLHGLGLAHRRYEALTENLGRRPDHVGHLAQLLSFEMVIGNPACVPDVDVGARAEDAVAELLLETGHQRQCDDERHDADRHAKRGDERDDRDERLLPLRQQIPEGDVQLEGQVSHRPRNRERTEQRQRFSVFSRVRGQFRLHRCDLNPACASRETG